jgi:hypothetical protein
VVKIGGIGLQSHLSGRFQFGKLGSRSHFEALNDIFFVEVFETLAHTLHIVLHSKAYPTVQKSPQLELVCESYASHKLTYLIDHYYMSGCHVIPHYSNMWGWPHVDFKKIIEGPNLITN